MYIILEKDTWCCHEGTVVRRTNLDSRDYREGFVTHINRNAEQIAEAVEHMTRVQKTRLIDDLK